MKPATLPKLSLNKISNLFTGTADSGLLLDTSTGDGFIQSFKLEKGLRVNILDCSFFEGIELYNKEGEDKEQQPCFTLAYFPDRNGRELITDANRFQKPAFWNSVFFSAASDFRIAIEPATRCRCVSVSFSRDWLLNVLQTNHTLHDLKEKVSRMEKLKVMQSMTPEERELLEELFLGPKQQHFRSFYIKAAVLKLVCDFLQSFRNEQAFLVNTGLHVKFHNIEQYINEHITKAFAGTKVLAEEFSVSESTLKRHFRKKFGISVYAYITFKKMQYAKDLIHQQGITIAEASHMVGYQSVQNFKDQFRKHLR